MTARPRPSAAIAVGLATLAAITAMAGPSAAQQAATRSASSAALAAAASQAPTANPAGHTQVLTLLTGDRLAVTANPVGAGPEQVSAMPTGQAEGIVLLKVGGTSYEIPGAALAYLGRGLDPRLFSVTALAEAERGGQIPVTLAYRSRVPALPGVTITRAAAGTAAGYLTASSAKAFGAALARQSAADTARASFGTDGLFGDGVSLSLAGSAAGAARSAQPGTGEVLLGAPAHAADPATEHTLTFRADDYTGEPASSGTVFLANVDNSNLLQAVSTFSGGTAAFTVPAGHYFAAAIFEDTAGQFTVGQRITVVPQITVSADTTVRTDALAATSKLTMVTPRPAMARLSSIVLRRVPASGAPIQILVGSIILPTRISPTTTPPGTGKLDVFTAQTLYSPPSAHPPYRFNLFYQDLSGIIRPQRYLIRPAALATVHARYGSATTFNASIDRQAVTSLSASLRVLVPIRLPARMTEYFNGNPSVAWNTFLLQGGTSGGLFLQQYQVRSYRAGERITENWNGYPLHPAPVTNTPGAFILGPLLASATRARNVLTLYVIPFSDNVPGHQGGGFEQFLGAARFTIDQNGKQVAGGYANYQSPFLHATLSPKPAVIRVTLDASRDRLFAALYPLGARSHTVWTWRSAPSPGATLPAGWTCPSILLTSLPDRNCAAQPLLSLYYHVAGINLRGAARTGRQSVTILVSHFQPSASTATITSVTARVSFDDGRTWHTATVNRTAPRSFVARYVAPASARYVTLSVTAADARGSTITETLPRAYRIIR